MSNRYVCATDCGHHTYETTQPPLAGLESHDGPLPDHCSASFAPPTSASSSNASTPSTDTATPETKTA